MSKSERGAGCSVYGDCGYCNVPDGDVSCIRIRTSHLQKICQCLKTSDVHPATPWFINGTHPTVKGVGREGTYYAGVT